MKLLLTSAGVTNASIRNALVELLGKPIAESTALCIPTAAYGHPMLGPESVWRFTSGRSCLPMVDLGWKSVGVLELTALPSTGDERWVTWVRDADVLLVGGGDSLYLAHWMRESGLIDLLPSLRDTVWVGLSAGSMVLTPRVGAAFVEWKPPDGGDEGLGIVDFSICPHLAREGEPGNSMAEAQAWAATIPGPGYAIDDDTAITVVDGVVAVVSEGHWTLFNAASVNADDLPALELGRPGPERDSGVAAILDGTKTTMTGLPVLHELDGERQPAVGDRFCVLDSAGRPAAVIEMTRVETEPINGVTDDYARAEGRGYRDAAQWRTAHEQFFRSEFVAGYLGYVPEIDDDTLVLTQWFRPVLVPDY